MPKEHQIIRAIEQASSTFRVMNSIGPKRLYYPLISRKFKATYQDIAKYISGDSETHDYFLDTNFITAEDVPNTVWDALSLKRITLTEGVWHELGPWRAKPFYNRELVAVFGSANNSRNERVILNSTTPWPSTCRLFRAWYTNVLSERKREAYRLFTQFVDEHGREPDAKEERSIYQSRFRDRDISMLQKGRREITSGVNVFTDQELIVTAALVCFAAGRSATVISRDHDVFEHFFKLTEMLSIHYQATLFAQKYSASPLSFEKTAMPSTPETRLYFDVNNSFLVKKHVAADRFFADIIPADYTPVRLRCVLITGKSANMAITPLSFIGETAMKSLIDAKGLSGGLHTDLLDGLNCHVSGFPKGIPNPREFVIIAADHLVPEATGLMKFPRLDLAHALIHDSQLMTLGP